MIKVENNQVFINLLHCVYILAISAIGYKWYLSEQHLNLVMSELVRMNDTMQKMSMQMLSMEQEILRLQKAASDSLKSIGTPLLTSNISSNTANTSSTLDYITPINTTEVIIYIISLAVILGVTYYSTNWLTSLCNNYWGHLTTTFENLGVQIFSSIGFTTPLEQIVQKDAFGNDIAVMFSKSQSAFTVSIKTQASQNFISLDDFFKIHAHIFNIDPEGPGGLIQRIGSDPDIIQRIASDPAIQNLATEAFKAAVTTTPMLCGF